MDNLVIFEKETQTKDIILGYLSDYNEMSVDRIFEDYDEGIKYVKETKPKAVLFSMLADKEKSFKMIKRISDFGVNVIVLSGDYTTANIIQTLRYGAKDFVSKPVLKKDLLVALIKCAQEEVKVLKKSRVISVFSNKGGVGKTAIATNLAVEFAKLTREKVALVDLNLPIGDVTTFLDIRPTIDISEVVNNAKQRDDKFILDACQKYKDTSLYVLAEPPYIEQSRSLTPDQVVKLFEYLRDTFSYIVIDTGTNVDKLNMTILENSDIVMLVTIVNLPLIRNCQRCLDLFENLEFPAEKTKVIINRYLENDEITVEDVEKTLNKPVYWKIPNNYFTIMSSINKGIPLSEVNENSNITESFVELASKLADDLFKSEFGQ
ncbi:MAG: AAA family ATPase [Candidatus Gastranaerophilales bacterium]|nr:AAA family ATPase [Candidatus Gastranaerophilales bacterium]